MNLRRILVTGSAGMLGNSVLEELRSCEGAVLLGAVHTKPHLVPGIPEMRVELTDRIATGKMLNEFDPDIIVHCAAKVSVDACERDRQYARALHVDASAQLASHRSGTVGFMYVSTDSVFDGADGDYTSVDESRPLNFYARTKRDGEVAVLTANPRAAVIRTNIYGFHVPPGLSLFEWAYARLSEKQDVPGFEDIFFNPLYTRQLARIISILIRDGSFTGILHAGCNKTLSKYAFLRLVAEEFGFPQDMVVPSREEFSPLETPRPKNTTLNTEQLRSMIGSVPDIFEGIRALRADHKEKFDAIR